MSRSDQNTIYLRDTSESSPLMACLFGGRLRAFRDIIEMDSWLPFQVRTARYRDDWRALKTLMEFRKAMDRMLSGAFQDLTKMRPREPASAADGMGMAMEGQRQYLADVGARKIFADGLVEVLKKDVKSEKEAAGVRVRAGEGRETSRPSARRDDGLRRRSGGWGEYEREESYGEPRYNRSGTGKALW